MQGDPFIHSFIQAGVRIINSNTVGTAWPTSSVSATMGPDYTGCLSGTRVMVGDHCNSSIHARAAQMCAFHAKGLATSKSMADFLEPGSSPWGLRKAGLGGGSRQVLMQPIL